MGCLHGRDVCIWKRILRKSVIQIVSCISVSGCCMKCWEDLSKFPQTGVIVGSPLPLSTRWTQQSHWCSMKWNNLEQVDLIPFQPWSLQCEQNQPTWATSTNSVDIAPLGNRDQKNQPSVRMLQALHHLVQLLWHDSVWSVFKQESLENKTQTSCVDVTVVINHVNYGNRFRTKPNQTRVVNVSRLCNCKHDRYIVCLLSSARGAFLSQALHFLK